MSGIVIAGTHSGCGKTTVSLGLMAALRARGLMVQPFKAGPDFIDTGLHRLAAGLPSRNLDIWMCGLDYVKGCFVRHSSKADISVVEGVMGLYDGDNSTYRLASALRLPIILAVDTYAMAESAGAVVKGFLEYDTERLIKGVIFNRVGSDRHLSRICKGITGIEVVGYLPRGADIEMPSRHLGLMVAEEGALDPEALHRLADLVAGHIDLDMVIGMASKAVTVEGNGTNNLLIKKTEPLTRHLRIAIAYDRAFCFYYEDNLDLLRDAGAKIAKFSPLEDNALPSCDMVYIGGGYPELYAERLSMNRSMLKSIKHWSYSGMPLYAECGGMMYLSREILDFEGRAYQMTGVFDIQTRMNRRLNRLGYREVEILKDCVIGKAGSRFRGQEFHYSEIVEMEKAENIYRVTNNEGSDVDAFGLKSKNTLASYVHIHLGSNSDAAGYMIKSRGKSPA